MGPRLCRRAFILNHFGEAIEPPCNGCDVCERLALAQERLEARSPSESPASLPDASPAEPFEPGTRVEHDQLGGGTVAGYEDRGAKIKINFDLAGEKLLATGILQERQLLRRAE